MAPPRIWPTLSSRSMHDRERSGGRRLGVNEANAGKHPSNMAASQAARACSGRAGQRAVASSAQSDSDVSVPHVVSAGEGTLLHGAIKTMWHGAKRFLSDYAFMQIQHRRLLGRWPNMRHPAAYNESILLRCLHPDMRWVTLTDKLAVREYVRRKVGDDHLIPLLAAPERFTRDVFDALPSAFVMKANHGCAFVKVVRDKSKTSFDALRVLADKWLAIDYSRASRERHYRFIKPRLYFEQLLIDEETGKIPSDLKLHVFRGLSEGPRIYTMVVSDRFGDVHGDLYDEQWKRMNVTFGPYVPSDAPMPRPRNWAQIERVALRLAEDFGYVRVDLYSLGDKVYFGELTFTPGAGVLRFTPDSIDYEWGRLLRESTEGFERMR
ncbi:hypothetical protein LMG24076_03484 [Trinickia soli]|nr:hypothetical protein LMG24076_03484 [Trinickia soli]